MVRALGRELRLRDRRGAAGAGRDGGPGRGRVASAARCAGWSSIRTRTAGGARTRAPTTTQAWIGRGDSTASQTAWALLALHAAGEARAPSRAVARGVAWLVATQRADGTWDEPQYTGTGFPSDYYINYHLYRLTFPIMALGRCLGGVPDGAGSALGEEVLGGADGNGAVDGDALANGSVERGA